VINPKQWCSFKVFSLNCKRLARILIIPEREVIKTPKKQNKKERIKYEQQKEKQSAEVRQDQAQRPDTGEAGAGW